MHHVTCAALVSENRLLTHPGSTDSIPTNVEKEDHVSMGPLCARKAKQILENTETILAIEAVSACQALEFRKPLKPAVGPRFLYRTIREKVAPLDKDRYLHTEIEWVRTLFSSGELHRRARQEGLL
jgi:histidine ammonia-lyase